MRVKIGDKIYDGEHEAIMVILSDYDKQNIAGMPADNQRYCCFPEDADEAKILDWMDEGYEHYMVREKRDKTGVAE